MKTIRKFFFSLIALFLFTGITIASATGTDVQKTYTWKYNVNKDASVVTDNYDCNLTIHTWDKGEVEYHLVIDAKARSESDATTLDNFLTNLKFDNSATSVRLGSTFYESRNSIMGRITIKLKGGKTVALTDFGMKAELWVPATCKLGLTSKYSEINMENISGPLKLDLYNDNLYGGNVEAFADIIDKYSTMEFKDMKDVKADLYNSKLDAKNTGNLKVESKYAKVTAEIAGKLDIDSYNDKYNFTRTGDITFVAKYSDLKSDAAGKVKLDFYNGSVIIPDVKDVEITTKYADCQFVNADNISVISSYNDKFAATKATSLAIAESKYCSFRIDEVKNSVTDKDGYEDKFNILKIGQDFKEITLTGKYLDINVGLPKSASYKFKAKITYPNLDVDESSFKPIKKISNGSDVEYDAVKGLEKEGMPVIEVNGYEVTLKIKEL